MTELNKEYEFEAKFAKLRPDAIIPSKRDEDAGYDVYACFDEEEIVLQEGEIKMIPTGIISAYPEQWCVRMAERGSTGTKGLARRAGEFDSGFRNEWKVVLNNTSHKVIIISKDPDKTRKEQFKAFTKYYDNLPKEKKKKVNKEKYVNNIIDRTITIYPYKKAIAQFLFVPVPKVLITETTAEEVMSIKSERGEGMLGSSGK